MKKRFVMFIRLILFFFKNFPLFSILLCLFLECFLFVQYETGEAQHLNCLFKHSPSLSFHNYLSNIINLNSFSIFLARLLLTVIIWILDNYSFLFETLFVIIESQRDSTFSSFFIFFFRFLLFHSSLYPVWKFILLCGSVACWQCKCYRPTEF